MHRRQFVGLALPLIARTLHVRAQDVRLSVVLRGGRFFRDGHWQHGDVGIDSKGKLRFGPWLTAGQVIDVTGKVVAPGFIDILADNGDNPAVTFPVFEKYKVSDGVTTALQMHGGSADCDAFFSRLGSFRHRINYGVSTFVIGIRNRTQDRAARIHQVERNLAEGALGVSHSLEYQPTPFDEVVEYAKLARRYDRPFFLHLRYSSREQELAGVDEAIQIARVSGARLHIDHLHSTGGTFHMEGALERIRAGISEGLRLTVCVYPYSYWTTYLSSRRFDPGWQNRYGLTYSDLKLVGTGECLSAESFARYRKSAVLVAVPEGTMPSERTIDLALKEDYCMIGSDGGILKEPRANSHPRGAGCFATAIRHGLDRRLPLERILEKVTELPRSLLLPALMDRGVLQEGAVADLTVFDPAAIRGNATVSNPNQFSSGIELVMVGGRIAYRSGVLGAQAGVPIGY